MRESTCTLPLFETALGEKKKAIQFRLKSLSTKKLIDATLRATFKGDLKFSVSASAPVGVIEEKLYTAGLEVVQKHYEEALRQFKASLEVSKAGGVPGQPLGGHCGELQSGGPGDPRLLWNFTTEVDPHLSLQADP